MSDVLLLRADADPRMGTGHVLRGLALAQAWQDAGGTALLRTQCPVPRLLDRLQRERVPVLPVAEPPGSAADAAATRAAARDHAAAWVALDGYHMGGSFQESVRRDGPRVLALDDFGHAGHYAADLVLNQNLHAHAGLYPRREPHTHLLLGPRYALLRREFLRWRGWQRPVPDVARKLLVTLGGSDPGNLTRRVLAGLAHVDIPGLEVVVVAGSANPHLPTLAEAARAVRGTVTIRLDVADMTELFAWADLVVTAGGTTTWEILFFGLTGLVLIVADNQAPSGEMLAREGLFTVLPDPDRFVPEEFAAALTRLAHDAPARRRAATRRLIDGDGPVRVVAALKDRS